MNTNRKYLALAAVIALITIGIGVFFFTGSTGSTAPADPATAQSITVKARDTNGVALNGVAVQLIGPDNTQVTSGTITAGGQVSLSFNPKPGTYVVTATEPTGYHARDDKDGGASEVNGPSCSNVYLCIYLTATEVQDSAGNKSIVVTLSHVRPEQVDQLDDLWFEMTPPAVAEEEPISMIDPADDEDILIGDPSDDLLDDGGLDQESAEVGDILIDAGSDDDADPVFRPLPGLAQVCINTEHQPVPGQNSASGVWVRGEVYGLDGGWIWVEGPTINNGEPVQISIDNGVFEGPLGINSYGDHPIERFELQGPGPSDTPIDLLATLNDGPGTVFPVDSNEGPIFDNECFDFDAPTSSDDASAELTVAEQRDQQLGAASAEVESFLNGFVEDHTSGDTAGLLDTLHPAVPLAFGEAMCSEYIAETTGSITGATVLDVQLPQSIDMDTPNGPITFPEAIPFTVEFELGNGGTAINEANLAIHDGESHWLTRCGDDG